MKGNAARIRVTKIFSFEMAHALHGYDGPCKNIHGHSYELSVTVIGNIKTDIKDPKYGMVVDFTDLKKIIKEEIIDEHDHALALNRNSPHKKLKHRNMPFGKIVLTNFQPTCENLLLDFASKIKNNLPNDISLHHLKLKETSTSFAEWYAEDNN